jgi:benzoyl-CoA reductase/2-hydroxyglutaryl-CoA dehydratase subunit BcrC/BadD/HgdB
MVSPKLAYFDSSHDLPEEIIMAAGFTPYKILGDVHIPNDPADQYLPNFFCPAARSFLTEALAKSKEWVGIAVAHGCDATNRHFDIWKMHVKTPFLYWFNTPMNTNKTAAKFLKHEIIRFLNQLEKQYNITIPSENIQKAIRESNQVKLKLQQAGILRGKKDITNTEYFDICRKAVQLPKTEVITALDALIANWEKRKDFPSDKKAILLTGSDITYPEWMQVLDDAGLRVVRDDLSIGERYYASLIPVTSDPLDGLVEYHLKIPSAATRNPPDGRLDYLLQALQDNKLKGMISQNLKFCEVYAYDSLFTLKGVKDKGYQAIHLEREFSPVIDHQLLNRLEAFKEMI